VKSPQPSTPDTVAQLVPSPLPGDPVQATVHRLSNGMTVYLSVDHTLPEVQTYIVVGAGSAEEPSSSTGLAHYLEHMMFKGTKKLGTLDYPAERPHLQRIAELYDALARAETPEQRTKILADIDAANQAAAAFAVPNDFDRLYGRLGIAGLNAYTWFDETAYFAVVPSNRLEQWATVEAERFSNAVFRLFLPELESVYEEKNLELDSPGDQTEIVLRRLLLGDHPYAHSILGTIEDLKTPAYGDMVRFFQRWYAPSNMAVILAGDVDPATVLPILERTLGELDGAAAPPREVPPIQPLKTRRFAQVRAPGTAQVRMAWPTPGASDPDAVAVEVLAELLDNEGTGLLTLALERTQIVPTVGASTTTVRAGGWITVSAVARDDQPLVEVERLLMEQVQRLKDGDFTDRDVQAVIRQLELDELYEWEGNGSRASELIESFARGVDWPEMVQARARRRALRRDDLMKVAGEVLGPGVAVVHRTNGKLHSPSLTKPKITPLRSNDAAESPYATRIAETPVDPLTPKFVVEGRDVQRGRLPTGELLSARNAKNALMQVSYRYEVGEHERPKLCVALQLLQVSDTAHRSADQLHDELYRLGGTIDFDCAPHRTSIDVFGPDANLPRIVALLHDWLSTATTDEARWTKLRDNTLSLRRDALDSPEFQSALLGYYALMDRQSPFLNAPSNEDLEAAKPAELFEEVRRLLATPHRTLYFGPRAPEDLTDVVDLGTATETVSPRPPLHLRHPTRNRVFVLDQARVGVDVSISWARPTPKLDERAAVRVLNYYLDGDSSSRVYHELREARGLVYSSDAGFVSADRPIDDAYFDGSLSTQADKTIEALDLLLKVVTDPVEDELFAIARGSVEQSMRRDRTEPRSRVYSVAAWDDEGIGTDPGPAIWTRLQSLEPADIERLLAPLREQPVIITIAGDLDAVGRHSLLKFGAVTEVTAADLTSW
jgi:predicted Zn-dependent peptidase